MHRRDYQRARSLLPRADWLHVGMGPTVHAGWYDRKCWWGHTWSNEKCLAGSSVWGGTEFVAWLCLARDGKICPTRNWDPLPLTAGHPKLIPVKRTPNSFQDERRRRHLHPPGADGSGSPPPAPPSPWRWRFRIAAAAVRSRGPSSGESDPDGASAARRTREPAAAPDGSGWGTTRWIGAVASDAGAGTGIGLPPAISTGTCIATYLNDVTTEGSCIVLKLTRRASEIPMLCVVLWKMSTMQIKD
jgi:hypothetical protein